MGMIGLLTVMSSSSVYAQDHKPEINAVEIIFDHVQDSYWWHITTINDRHLSIYLPVFILRRRDGTCFHLLVLHTMYHIKAFTLRPEGIMPERLSNVMSVVRKYAHWIFL